MDLLRFYEWLDIKTILLFSCVFLLLADYIKNKAPKNFPPGPWSLPIIGDLHHINHNKIHLQVAKFAEKYGDILSIRFLGPRTVMLNGYKRVKEVYLQQGDNLADRPVFPMIYDLTEDKGLIAASGYKWKHQRRFALSTLRNFGLGKKSLEPSIHLECTFLNEAISNEHGGTETTSATLCWALLYMMKYPEIQAKVQEEIDRVVGGSRQPSLSDKDNMPYTNAVIHEIQRIGNIAPLNLPRATVEDTQIGTYSIPKGTAVTGNLTSVLFDESEWETPHSFNPGHFLDAEGKLRKRDAFLPFSLGKRVCPGEQLARMELFLFFSSLLQRFTFSSPPGVEPSMDYRLGATRCPLPYKLCAVVR